MNPLSLVTWLIDHLLRRRGNQPRLHLSASSKEGGPWFGFADQYTGRVSTYGGGPEVVIRAIVAGAAVEIERIGMKLDDGAVEWFDSGSALPAVLDPPSHVEVSADRARLKAEIGNRRVKRLMAVDTGGRQFEDKVPKEWQTPVSWPG